MAENCKFSQNSSLTIDGRRIIIAGRDLPQPRMMETDRLRLRQPIYISEGLVHAIGMNGAVYEITATGYLQITEEGAIAWPR